MFLTHNPIDLLDTVFKPVRNQEKTAIITDIVEKKDKFLLNAELAGFNPENVNITLEKNQLVIEAERNFERKDDEKYHVERFHGTFRRSYQLPENVDRENIKADFKHGLLSLEIPKSAKHQPKKISINLN